MAREEVTLEVKVEGGNSGKTLKDLRDEVEDLNKQLEGVPVGSKEFDRLAKEVSQAEREVKNLELSFESLDNDQVASEIGSVAGAIGDVTTGLFLLGGENENLEELAQNIETALGVSMALKGAIEGISSAQKLWTSLISQYTIVQKVATQAAKIFQAITKSTLGLLGFITTAIGGLVAIVNSFTSELSAAEKAQNAVNDAMAEANKEVAAQETRITILTEVVKDNTTSQQDRKEALDELNEILGESVGLITAETIATGEATAAIQKHLGGIRARAEARAIENQLTELSTRIMNNELALQTELADANDMVRETVEKENEGLRQQQQLLLEQSVLREQEIKDSEGVTAGRQKNVEEKGKEVQVQIKLNKAKEKEKEINKEVDNSLEELRKARLEQREALLEELAALQEEDFQRQLSQEEREVRAVELKFQELLNRARQFGVDTAELERLQQEEILAIRDEFRQLEAEAAQQAKDEADAQKEADKQKAQEEREEFVQNTIDSAQATLDALTAIQSLSQGRELKRIKEKQKAGEELTKAEQKRLDREEKINRAFAVAQLAIDTARAVSAGVASAAAIPFPGNIAAIISTVATVLANIATAKNILGADLPSVGASGGGGTEAALDGGTEQPDIDPIQAGSTFLNDEPTKVVVLESDITNTQNNVQVIESQATFG